MRFTVHTILHSMYIGIEGMMMFIATAEFDLS
jgi:hypothetical protein